MGSIVIPDSVTAIREYGFAECTNLESIVIPNSVTTIEKCAFDLCTSVKEIICKATTPPKLSFCTWSEEHLSRNCTLYVPDEVINAYKETVGWSIFTKILGLSAYKNNQLSIDGQNYYIIEKLDNGLIIVSKKNLTGCVNQDGAILIPPKYKSLVYQDNLLIATYHDDTNDVDKCGIFNLQGDQIMPFTEEISKIKIEFDIILYKVEEAWGAYTLQGESICKPIYDCIMHFSDNIIKVESIYFDFHDNRRYEWKLIDYHGKEIFPVSFESIGDSNFNGIVRVCNNSLWGYINTAGKLLLNPKYAWASDFEDGYAIVSTYHDDNKGRREKVYGVINIHFDEVIPCTFHDINYDKDSGLFDIDFGDRTLKGKFIISADEEDVFVVKNDAEDFNGTCAIAFQANEEGGVSYGLTDKGSNNILPIIYSDMEYISDGVYKFKLDGLYGLVDSKGNIILQNKFSHIDKFEDGLARVTIRETTGNDGKELYGYIDLSGNEILQPSYERISYRHDGCVTVMRNNQWGFFNTKSRQLNMFPDVAYLDIFAENLCRFNEGGIYNRDTKRVEGGLWGYISVDGEIAIEPTYDFALWFMCGATGVRLDNKYGLINTDGEFIVPCEYDSIVSSYENTGKWELSKDDEIFVFDNTGKVIKSYYPQEEDNSNYDDYDYDDDTPSIYDNPYYDDDLDMDQQSIDFWNNL